MADKEDSEQVDILVPPLFVKGGEVKTRAQAAVDADWTATFNLWIVRNSPQPAIVYQQRSLNKSWAPGKLDVAAGGNYAAGEDIADGLREVREELGKDYDFEKLINLGRKVYVGKDRQGRTRYNLINVFMTEDDSELTTFKLQADEVAAIVVCPISELIKVHTDENYSFTTSGVDLNQAAIELEVRRDSFPENWDNYHYKMAVLAQRYFQGDKNLIY